MKFKDFIEKYGWIFLVFILLITICLINLGVPKW